MYLPSGFPASFVYSFLQLMQGGGFVIGWQSILGDYIVAYSVLGLAGLFHKKRYGFYYGILVGGAARFLCHYFTGATIWAVYMPESFFGMTMTSPWFYSLLYNGSYMLPSIILCVVVFALLYKPLKKYFTSADLLIQK